MWCTLGSRNSAKFSLVSASIIRLVEIARGTVSIDMTPNSHRWSTNCRADRTQNDMDAHKVSENEGKRALTLVKWLSDQAIDGDRPPIHPFTFCGVVTPRASA